jgi:dienelactone hydrolase
MTVRLLVAACFALLVAGCGGSGGQQERTTTATAPTFAYDRSRPLDWADNGRVNANYPIAIRDVTFTSGGRTIEAYLLQPPGTKRRPAVVVVHGSGGDRSQLLLPAAWLAARGFVVLTTTAPSTSYPPPQATGAALLQSQRRAVVRDVVAVRQAVDGLSALPTVDPKRIGYLGWSAGAKTGILLASAEPRVGALALLSAGAQPLSAFVAAAPAGLRDDVRRVLGPVDPVRQMARARPGTILLEEGRRDEVIPRAALMNVVRAAPKGTTVRWYDSKHELTPKAYLDAFDWLARKLGVRGPAIPGTQTGPSR